MAPQVSVSLNTLAGASLELTLEADSSVHQAKEAASQELGRPADLQRWLVEGSALEDDALLRDVLQSSSAVFCVFLPRTFEVQVKVISWAHGNEAEYARDVRVAVSPSLTIDAVKYEIAGQCGLPAGSNMRAARLIKGGLQMDNEKTVEQYHLDPNMKLHCVVPRGCTANAVGFTKDGVGSEAIRVPELRMPKDDQIINLQSFEDFYGLPKGNYTNRGCPETDKNDAKDGQQSPKGKDPNELLRTHGRYPLRPRRRSASTPPERGSRLDDEIAAAPALTLPRAAAVHLPTSPASRGPQEKAGDRVNLKDVAESEVRPATSSVGPDLRGLNSLRIEEAKPAIAGNASASPCGASRRPPRPPTRPPTQSGDTERPSTQRGGMERPPTQRGGMERPPTPPAGFERPPTQRGDMERPPTQRGGSARPPTPPAGIERPLTQRGGTERPSSSAFNAASSVESRSLDPTSPRQTQRAQGNPFEMARSQPRQVVCTPRLLSQEGRRARSVSVSRGIDRWAQLQHC